MTLAYHGITALCHGEKAGMRIFWGVAASLLRRPSLVFTNERPVDKTMSTLDRDISPLAKCNRLTSAIKRPFAWCKTWACRAWLALLFTTLAACATAPTKRVYELLQREPNSPSLLYLDAAMVANHDRARALADLQKLDAGGWNNPLDQRDFTALLHDPTWQVLAQRIAARSPQVLAASVAVRIEQCDLFPEGIAVDSRDGSLYLSSLWRRKIVQVAENGTVSTFANDRLYQSVGLHIDETRHRLWAAIKGPSQWPNVNKRDRGQAWLVALDLADGRVVTRVAAPGRGPHFLNDMAIAEDGTVYVTDTDAGAVYVLYPGKHVLQVFAPPSSLLYPNGIVVDGAQVLVAHAPGIARLPRHHGYPTELASSGSATQALGGIDGMALDGHHLYAVQNAIGRPRIVRIRLDAAHTQATALSVLDNQHPALALPTTLAIDRRRRALFIVADSHVDQLGPHGPVPGVRPTATVLRLPLPAM